MTSDPEQIRQQTQLLVQRELELLNLRHQYDRALSWWGTYQTLASGLDTNSTLQTACNGWTSILVAELGFQSAAVLQVQGTEVELVSRQPLLDLPPTTIEDAALWATLRASKVGGCNDRQSVIPKLTAALRLERFLWCLISLDPQTELLLVAGFDARVARYRPLLGPEDIAHFQLISRHLETLLKNVLLVQALDAQRRELERRLATITHQAELIRQLSTPVLEVWEDILVLPIVGELDSCRGEDMMQGVLARLTTTRAKCVILDVTGVKALDNKSAEYLIKLTNAASLLGAHCVLTGVRSSVAITLVGLGVDLGRIKTFRDLRAGLRGCMRFLQSE